MAAEVRRSLTRLSALPYAGSPAEEDARRVVEAAEQEIASAAKTAQRELKAFVAELSVDLASKKISVDSAADQGLVRSFVEQLGKDGK